ncbi:hypothetical protein MMC27_000084 [Xylographa pallens]|nr:hypothetical protein [Xylographa pallens]
MSQPPRQPPFEGADLQLYPDLSDLDQLFLSDDMGHWPGLNLKSPEATWPVTQTQQEYSAAGPIIAFNFDAHLKPDYDKYSFVDKANTSGPPQAYASGNTGLSVHGEHQSASGNSLWTRDIFPLTQWSSDAVAPTQTGDGGFPPPVDTTKSSISVPSDRVRYSSYGSNHGSLGWPPAMSPGTTDLYAAFSGINCSAFPTAMPYNILERPSEGANISVRQDISTSDVTAAKGKHVERDSRSAAVSEQRDLSTEAEDVDHGPTGSTSGHVCHECGAAEASTYELEKHAYATGHGVRRCKCGKGFTRMADLKRHLENFKPEGAKHPCTLCRLYRGDDAFKRKDHLTQHLRGFHKIDVRTSAIFRFSEYCRYSECPQHRMALSYPGESWVDRHKNAPFTSQAAYTQHLREVHDESPFPCDVAHCPRTGAKGYSRRGDMLKHRKRDHPDAPEYREPSEKTTNMEN